MVVGRSNRYKKYGKIYILTFLTQILNGNFDADKLDYAQRDSDTSGLALTYGIERFLMKILVYKDEYIDINGEPVAEYRLCVGADAVTTVEELIFNRNMLYVYMYRHQKVLCVEAVSSTHLLQ